VNVRTACCVEWVRTRRDHEAKITMTLLATGLFGLGGMEFVILIILGVLLFGRKLPEVGRSLGKGIVEFKKGLKGLEDDVEGQVARSEPAVPIEAPRPPQRVGTPAPKFETQPTDSEGKPRYP
jgi:sec-independent protein translocase protein TatA